MAKLSLKKNKTPETEAPAEEMQQEKPVKSRAAAENRQKPNRRRKPKTKLSLPMIGLMIAMALLVVGLAYLMVFMVQKSAEYVFDTDAVQYYAGDTFRINKGAAAKPQKDGTVKLADHGAASELDSLLAFSTQTQKATITTQMLFYAPRERVYYSVPRFSELEYDSFGPARVRFGKKTVGLKNGFFYDGNNYFVFGEAMELYLNGYTIKVGPMSCVEANGNGTIVIYDAATGENYTETATTAVKAKVQSGGYMISLTGDSVELDDGTKMLLLSKPELADSIF